MTDYLKNTFDLNSDKLIEVLDEVPFWSAPFGLKLLDAIYPKANTVALDIGFGAGFPLTEIAMRLGKTSKVYGLDPWHAAAKRARKKIEIYGLSNVELLNGVAENIPLSDNSIDLITSNNGINNVEDLDKCLSECARVIKDGGQFVQTVNLDSTMHEFYAAFKIVLREKGLDECVEKLHNHIYAKRKPLAEFVQLIKKQGFLIEDVNNHSFEYRFVSGTTMFNHYFIRLAFLDSWKKIVPENIQIEVFNTVEHLLNEQAKIKGYLKLTVPFVVINSKKN